MLLWGSYGSKTGKSKHVIITSTSYLLHKEDLQSSRWRNPLHRMQQPHSIVQCVAASHLTLCPACQQPPEAQ